MDIKPIQYEDIDNDILSESLEKYCEVRVYIPTRYARACEDLLEVAHNFSHMKRSNIFSRLIKLIHGLWVTFTVLLLHSKLIELATFYVMSDLQAFKMERLDDHTFELCCNK